MPRGENHKHLKKIADFRRGKTLEEIYGKEKALFYRKNLKIHGIKKGQHLSVKTEFKKGHTNSEEIKQKISKKLKKLYKEGKLIHWNNGKTWEDLYGKEEAKRRKRNLSKKLRGKAGKYTRTKEIRKKTSEKKKRLYKEGKIKPWNKGLTKNNNEILNKISINSIGRKMPGDVYKRAVATRMKNGSYKWSTEWKERQSKRLKKQHAKGIITSPILKMGKDNFHWKGGLSFEPYGVEFNNRLKRAIKKRDKHTCQLCYLGQLIYPLCTHHIDYNKKNNDPENLITLCRSCHSKTNFNREYWTNLFQNEGGVK